MPKSKKTGSIDEAIEVLSDMAETDQKKIIEVIEAPLRFKEKVTTFIKSNPKPFIFSFVGAATLLGLFFGRKKVFRHPLHAR